MKSSRMFRLRNVALLASLVAIPLVLTAGFATDRPTVPPAVVGAR